jgi:phage shock protein C
MNGKRITRSGTERLLGGVCGGIAAYFGIDPTIVRIIFVLLALPNLFGVILYLVLWALLPGNMSITDDLGDRVQENVADIRATAETWVQRIRRAIFDR